MPIAGYRNYKKTYVLVGVACRECEKLYYPHAYICTCGSKDFDTYTFGGQGTLLTFTNTPSGLIGIIELQEGVRVLSQLVDTTLERLRIGMPVKAAFRRYLGEDAKGIIQYGIKFIPQI